mmetsp:Transcript_10188/g.15307  ORF Transcript_10188/g.15307 Transcript_10188/m.15307 type:complete len:216 (+) Transcript_10188:307-954(+)|eukprot:CAMPEP_0171455908 /NCGR_PEP_ID=MMETSP0945-20130129/2613_1 /TAXON_ID=109269 /ORGANISM="Vaucheria litorea, Strain CCMP2940" /LENGTH=215 /DNA_ID=CAMNT_0011981239 /DNA_START=303 /DNA_END=950 /DNA_ORIENTATION=+
MRVVQQVVVLPARRDVPGQDQRILAIQRGLQKVELGDKGMLDPIGQDLPPQNQEENIHELLQQIVVPPLTDVEQRDHAQEKQQLEPFHRIVARQLEQILLVELFENGPLYFVEVVAYEERQQCLVAAVDGHGQRRDVDEEQETVERAVNTGDREVEHRQPLFLHLRAPVQAVQRILAKRTHQLVEYFDHSDQNVQLDHALSSNVVVRSAHLDRLK